MHFDALHFQYLPLTPSSIQVVEVEWLRRKRRWRERWVTWNQFAMTFSLSRWSWSFEREY